MRLLAVGIVMALVSLLSAQDAYQVAPNNYRKVFENEWVRISHVTYRPGEKIGAHTHPAIPTIYLYLNEAGPIRFFHLGGDAIRRPPVKQGAIRFTKGSNELHEVESESETVAESLRIELLTEPLDLPEKDVRLAPGFEPFQNRQVRIQRMMCDPAPDCVAPKGPGVWVVGSTPVWVPESRTAFRLPPEIADQLSKQNTVQTYWIQLRTKPRGVTP
jgi:hypothetical protein